MVDCEECSSSFDSEHALNVHMGMKHPEISNRRICADCGEEFQCDYEKKYCSDCNSYGGKKNGNYREGAKEKTSCNGCGGEFEYYPSNKEGQYCSECQKDRPWASRGSNIERIKNFWDQPEHIGNSKRIECDWCREEIKRSESEIGENNFCCKQCQSDWLSEEFTGEGHPNWEEDYPTEDNYGKGWRRVKLQALERDEYTCQKCGIDRGELERNPSVHHIMPVKTFENEQDAHTLSNLVSLCPSCHRQEEWKIKNEEVESLEWLPEYILQPE